MDEKKCTKCGVVKGVEEFYKKLDKYSPQCKNCVNQRNKEQYRLNTEILKARAKRYRENNVEACKERNRKYYKMNSEQIYEGRKQYLEKYRKEHKEESEIYQKEYYQQNRNKITKRIQNYSATENGKLNALRRMHKYRSKLNNLPFSWTEADIRFCLDYWNNSCANCGAVFDDSVKLHWDHYIPISDKNCKGTIPKNMLCLCQHCNTSKNKRLPTNFFDESTLDKIELYFSLLEDRTEAESISDELDLMVTKLLH